MPRPPSHRTQDMYWFAHGGIETNDVPPKEVAAGDPEDETVTDSKCNQEKSSLQGESQISTTKHPVVDRQDSAYRANQSAKRLVVEEHKRQIQATEQEKSDAILKKHAEREAALEARRNAQRNNMSYAFGANLPPKMEFDIVPVQLTAPTTTHSQPPKPAVNLMTQSMTASMMMSTSTNGTRGRRRNDLTPTVPYDRITASQRSASSVARKRSVSMSRLDQLALPRKSYVEAQKNGSANPQFSSPKRPLSSASEKSSKSNRVPSAAVVSRRPQTSFVRKPRPVSIAGSAPDPKRQTTKPSVPPKRMPLHSKKADTQKTSAAADAAPPKKSTNKPRSSTTNKDIPDKSKSSSPASSIKSATPRPPLKNVSCRQSTPKTSPARKLLTNKKKDAILAAAAASDGGAISGDEEIVKAVDSPAQSSMDEDSLSADDRSSSKQHITSEEEAKAALAEKRKLAREQAEKEAELERQRQEELKIEEEKRLRLEEEEQKRLEEEQLQLLEEHKRFEEEKLQRAIEEQEKRDEEEKSKREEEVKTKLEQEKKVKEEAEKQHIELEEKLKKEEEERAERKKRLEKIMSRTRGKSGTASPSGSLNGSDPPDSIENHPLSSDPSSLDSNDMQLEQSSPTEPFNINDTLLLASQSLSSNDLMLPSSEHTSLDANEPMSFESQKEVVSTEQAMFGDEETGKSALDDLVSFENVPKEMTSSIYCGGDGDHLQKGLSDEEEQLSDNKSESTDSQAGMNSYVEHQESCQNESPLKPNPIEEDHMSKRISSIPNSDVLPSEEIQSMLPSGRVDEDHPSARHEDMSGKDDSSVTERFADDPNTSVDRSTHQTSEDFREDVISKYDDSGKDNGPNNMVNRCDGPDVQPSESYSQGDFYNQQLLTGADHSAEAAFNASDIVVPNSQKGMDHEFDDPEQKRNCEEGSTIGGSDIDAFGDATSANQSVSTHFESMVQVANTTHGVSFAHSKIELNDDSGNAKDSIVANRSFNESAENEINLEITPFDEAEALPSYPLHGNQHVMSFADSPNREFDSSDDNINYCGVKSVTVAEINRQGVDYFQQVEYDPIDDDGKDRAVADNNNCTAISFNQEMPDCNDFQSSEKNLFGISTTTVADSNPFGGQMFDEHGLTNNPFSATETSNSINTNIFGTVGFDTFTHDSVCDQTLNPFSSEFIMRSSTVGPIAEESEESSLDSNLSQVMTVNTSEAVADSGLSNGQNAFCDMEDSLNSRGCNGIVSENRLSSTDCNADQLSSSSEKLPQYLADNGNLNIFDLDHTNSNKIAANPFLESTEKSFSTNLF